MRHSTARKYTPAPVEAPEPTRCECNFTSGTHTRSCAGIPDAPLELVRPLITCEVCGVEIYSGASPCDKCALWSCPPVGTAIVCNIRPADRFTSATKMKTFKGTVTRVDAAEPEDSSARPSP